MRRVDLNVDIGEGFPYDEALLEFATSASVCCGEHAGSWELTERTVELCLRRGVRIGCHPGFPDREGMGRRSPDELRRLRGVRVSELFRSVQEQADRFVRAFPAAYLKPHGALYTGTAHPVHANPWGFERLQPSASRGTASGPLVALLQSARLPLMGMPGTEHELSAKQAGVGLIREGFADRRYSDEGTLVARSEPGAVLEDPAEIARQVLRLAQRVDSICLHGDTPNCLEFAEAIKRALVDAGYEVAF